MDFELYLCVILKNLEAHGNFIPAPLTENGVLSSENPLSDNNQNLLLHRRRKVVE
jgi:hypothetical protein